MRAPGADPGLEENVIDVRRSAVIAALTIAMQAVPATAADLAAKLPVKAYARGPVYDWTGFYAGVNVGYGAASDPVNMTFTPATDGGEHPTIAPDGFIGGGQLGYNFQAGRVVFGIEGDIQASALAQSICTNFCRPGFDFGVTQELPWFATVRGRVGYAAGPALFYGTAGAAFTSVRTSLTSVAPGFPDVAGTFNDTKTGWAAGGGVEAMLGGHWTAKAEYLYMDFGAVTHAIYPARLGPAFPTTFPIDIREHVFRVGLNYLFSDPASGAATARQSNAYAMMPTALQAYRWSGFYVGGNLGAGVGHGPAEVGYVGGTLHDQTNFAARALNGGLQAGVNWQVDRLVLGFEGDIQLNDQRQKDCFAFCVPMNTTTFETRLPWFSTLRARFGYAAGPLLVYGTAGAALGRVDTNFQVFDTGVFVAGGAFSETRSGWTAGAGVEGALSERWTAKAEYLYLDLGSVGHAMLDNGSGDIDHFSTTIRDHIFRVGLNYRVGP